eukprot:c3019_g1_i1 orf=141-398(-)
MEQSRPTSSQTRITQFTQTKIQAVVRASSISSAFLISRDLLLYQSLTSVGTLSFLRLAGCSKGIRRDYLEHIPQSVLLRNRGQAS